eukprot:836515_1
MDPHTLLARAYSKHLFCDACFRFDTEDLAGIELYGMRAVLAANSDVFRAMFYGKLLESTSKETAVEISDISAESFEVLLTFAHTNSLDSLSMDNVLEVICAADKYQMTSLWEQCVEFVRKNINTENVCPLWSKSDSISSFSEVSNICTVFMRDNAWKVFEVDNGFLKHVPFRLMEKLLVNPDLKSDCEIHIFRGIVKWSEGNSHEDALKLLENVRFSLMSEIQLFVEVYKSKFRADVNVPEILLLRYDGEPKKSSV